MGSIEEGEVVCPLHGYKFDLKTGSCSTNPKLKVKVFKLVRQGDQFSWWRDRNRGKEKRLKQMR